MLGIVPWDHAEYGTPLYMPGMVHPVYAGYTPYYTLPGTPTMLPLWYPTPVMPAWGQPYCA